MPTTERSRFVHEFLESGVWHIAADRDVTRRAIQKVLEELPEEDFSRVVNKADTPIIMAATARYRIATVTPYALTLNGTAPGTMRISFIHLDGKLEDYPPIHIRGVVAHALEYALARLEGVSEREAADLANMALRRELGESSNKLKAQFPIGVAIN